MPLQSRPSQQKRLASVLAKTVKELEAASDPNDPAFVAMKAQILQRILELEESGSRARSVIHLVEAPEAEAEKPAADPKAHSA